MSWQDIYNAQPPQSQLCWVRRLNKSTPYVGLLIYNTSIWNLCTMQAAAVGFGDTDANGLYIPNGTTFNGWPVYSNSGTCILYRVASAGAPVIERAATPTTGTVLAQGGLTNYNSWSIKPGGTSPAGTCPISFIPLPSYLTDRWKVYP